MTKDDLISERLVAHYTKMDTFLKKILPKNQLMIGSIADVNDPFENYIDFMDDDPASGTEEDALKGPEQRDALNKILGQNIKLLSTTLCGQNQPVNDGVESLYYGIPMLWSHYGDNHKGICLILDKDRISESLKNISSNLYEKEIQYRSFYGLEAPPIQFSRIEFNNLKGNKEKLFKLILEDNYIDSRFFEKTKCWSVEREYRWLLYKDSTDKIYIPIMDTLVAIVIGAYYIRNDVLDKPLKKIRKYRKEHNLNFDIFALECKSRKYGIWPLKT